MRRHRYPAPITPRIQASMMHLAPWLTHLGSSGLRAPPMHWHLIALVIPPPPSLPHNTHPVRHALMCPSHIAASHSGFILPTLSNHGLAVAFSGISLPGPFISTLEGQLLPVQVENLGSIAVSMTITVGKIAWGDMLLLGGSGTCGPLFFYIRATIVGFGVQCNGGGSDTTLVADIGAKAGGTYKVCLQEHKLVLWRGCCGHASMHRLCVVCVC